MELDSKIASNVPWSELPTPLRTHLQNDPKVYDEQVIVHSLKNQLRFTGNLIQQVLRREKKYYAKLIDYSRKEHLIYPYHLQDKIVPGLRATPFVYYRDMLIDVVRREQSYDCLPNFTAADCLRVIGVGRNQYIEIMNTYRSFLTTAGPDSTENLYEILFDILPHEPVGGIHFQDWYIVRIGAVLVDDVKQSNEVERRLIDRIIDAEHCPISGSYRGLLVKSMDTTILEQLYKRGLVYIEVPVGQDDCLCVPTLEGFVMNRVNGDCQENLLYKIFVTADENTSIRELAECLEIDTQLVAQAASVFCRLGFAHKRHSSTGVADNPMNPGDVCLPLLIENGQPSPGLASLAESALSEASPNSNSRVTSKKLALIFDSTVTAYLMMGNLSVGLKPHAVTMFEVGKLSDDSLESFLSELDNLSTIDEGEARLYYEHAINLREAIHFLRSQARTDATDFHGIDLIRGGSLLSLEPNTRVRILQKNYHLIVSLSPMTYEDRQASSALWPSHLGPPVPEANSPWFRLFITSLAGGMRASEKWPHALPTMLLTRGARLHLLPVCFRQCSRFLLTAWGHDPITVFSNALLASVNDMLLNSPVLVQACDLQFDDLKIYQRYIPIPLPNQLDNGPTAQPEFLTRLSKHIDLHSLCGYLTVLAPCLSNRQAELTELDKNNNNNNSSTSSSMDEEIESASFFASSTLSYLEQNHPPDSKDDVITASELNDLVRLNQPISLVTLHLGLPIFNATLLRAVCEQVTRPEGCNVFSTDHRQRLELANQTLMADLGHFIHQTCLAEWPPSSDETTNNNGRGVDTHLPGPWPLPTQSLLCSDGCVTTLY